MFRLSPLKQCLPSVIALALAVSLQPEAIETANSQDVRLGLDDVVLVRPSRRPPDAPLSLPPELPEAAERVTPMTLHLTIRRQPQKGSTQTVRQVVSRTVDRVHVAAGGREWLFERNPVDPRRVSAWLVEHRARTLVMHEESDVRNVLGLNGWADVLMLGFDRSALSQLAPTGESRSISGFPFRGHSAANTDVRISGVWWNEDEALPGAFVIRDGWGATDIAIERLRRGVDAELLRSPALRFPKYKVMDRAEWLEGH